MALTGQAETLYQVDFSQSDGNYIPDDPYVLWEYGLPGEASDAPSSTPMWGIGLDSLYIKDARSILRSPTLSSLKSLEDLTLILVHAYSTDPSSADCKASLPESDDPCADGGTLRLRFGSEREVGITPDGGYPALMALDDSPVGAFAGSSNGWISSYFDLLGLADAPFQLELLFASNDVRTSTGSGWYLSSLSILAGDAIPPELSLGDPLEDTTRVEGTYDVWVWARDNRGLSGLSLEYTLNGQSAEPIAMSPSPVGPDGSGSGFAHQAVLTDSVSEGWWKGGIPAQAPNTTVWYNVVATDVNGNKSRLPSKDGYSFEVYLPGPTNLWPGAAEAPAEATEFRLHWDSPAPSAGCTLTHYRFLHQYTDATGAVSTQEVEGLARNPSEPAATLIPYGYPGTDVFSVIPVFSCDRGDGSGPFVAEGQRALSEAYSFVVPRITSITPLQVWQGSHVTLEVEGLYTRFTPDLRVELDEGFTLIEQTILDVTRCRLEVQVSTDAPEGPASLALHMTDSLVVRAPESLIVGSYAERPSIYQVTPASLHQRESATLTFYGQNVAFEAGQVNATFGDGISAQPSTVTSSTSFTVEVEVAGWAAAGARTITVVAGAQTFSVPFQVEPIPLEVSTGCSLATVDVAWARRSSPTSDGQVPGLLWTSGLLLAVGLHLRARRQVLGMAQESCGGPTSAPLK